MVSPWSHQWCSLRHELEPEVEANRLSHCRSECIFIPLAHLVKLHPGVTSQWTVSLRRPADMFSLAPEVLKNKIPIWMSLGWVCTFQYNRNTHHSLWPRAAYLGLTCLAPETIWTFSQRVTSMNQWVFNREKILVIKRTWAQTQQQYTQPYHWLSTWLEQVCWSLFPCLVYEENNTHVELLFPRMYTAADTIEQEDQ